MKHGSNTEKNTSPAHSRIPKGASGCQWYRPDAVCAPEVIDITRSRGKPSFGCGSAALGFIRG